MNRRIGTIFLGTLLLFTAPRVGGAAPITFGTIALDPDIVTPADATAFVGLSFTGVGDRLMFDRRLDAFAVFTAFLFEATFSDGLSVEIQVNPEFGTEAGAAIEAERYAPFIGQLSTALRANLQTIWIHQGVQPFGGGNNNILIHTGQADLYVADGILEETLVHEGAHTSLDPFHAAAPGWLAAQAADADFISTYASQFPDREDIAESFLAYMALRYRSDRISDDLLAAIAGNMPNRIAYFDSQAFDMFPVRPRAVPEPSSLALLISGGIGLLASRLRRRSSSR